MKRVFVCIEYPPDTNGGIGTCTKELAGLMVPTLSAFQNDSTRLGAAFRRVVRLVAFVGCRCLLSRMLNDDLMRMLPDRFAFRLRRALLLEREGLK